MKYLKIVVGIFVLSLASLVLFTGLFPSTQAVSGTKGIAKLEKVELCGMNQWISIRGEDRENPVLLWLHGGPGLAQMPVAHHFDKEIEKEFVVVHWDQRGAGKSNPLDFDESTMSFEQYMCDADELVEYLKKTLDKEKIYLVGHSWGSKLGIELVNEKPENFHAYISVNQIVDIQDGMDIAYEWLMEEVLKKNDTRSFRELERLGEPPYTIPEYRRFAFLVIEYGGNLDMSKEELVAIGLQSPEYTFLDYVQWLDGALRGPQPMWKTSDDHDIDYREEIVSLEVPVYFFIGKNDYTTPFTLVEEYHEIIDAPKKELVVFENSAHTPFLGETEKFYNEIIEVMYELESI